MTRLGVQVHDPILSYSGKVTWQIGSFAVIGTNDSSLVSSFGLILLCTCKHSRTFALNPQPVAFSQFPDGKTSDWNICLDAAYANGLGKNWFEGTRPDL